MSGPVIEKGTIVIKGNRIQAVGANVSAPSGAKVVDGNGASVYPGFIDGGTDLGLNEPGVRNYDDVNEMLHVQPDAAHARRVPVGQRRDSRRARRRHHDAPRSCPAAA